MRSIKSLKIYLASLLILSFATAAIASPGKYVQLNKGQAIPWSGWCFDKQAAAQILADKEFQEEQCKLKTDRALQIQLAAYDLEIGKLRADMGYEVSTRDTTIAALKKENLKLEEVMLNQSGSWYLYTAGGFVVGASFVLVVWAVIN